MNRSRLLQLGALGASLYLANKTKNARANNRNPSLQQRQEQLDNKQEKLDRNEKMTPFTFGKSLARKIFGRKM